MSLLQAGLCEFCMLYMLFHFLSLGAVVGVFHVHSYMYSAVVYRVTLFLLIFLFNFYKPYKSHVCYVYTCTCTFLSLETVVFTCVYKFSRILGCVGRVG